MIGFLNVAMDFNYKKSIMPAIIVMLWKPFTETSIPSYFEHVINLSANQ